MAKPPNILWIITDQQRVDALRCVTPWMHTSNLDQLASKGAHLKHFFTQSPVCVPSRINYITGRYPHSHRNRENNARVAPGEPHKFRVVKRAGYQMAVFGKNHMFFEEDLPKIHVDGTRVGSLW